MTNQTDKRFLLLHQDDNVFVCCQQVAADEIVLLEGDNLSLTTAIEVGHKLARGDIRAGDKILKYGVSIGSAKTDIKRAEHVHLHNIKSDYISSYTRSGVVTDANINDTNSAETHP